MKNLELKKSGVDVSEDEFELNLSVDGISIDNRSAIQMWPILMQLHNMPNVPVMVRFIATTTKYTGA
uniref:Uncharacterized protein n=1 Tax=Anopheles arabiensis TaxID=7173 RepID=A0A182HK02_ANOAR